MRTPGGGRNCERWDPEIRVDESHRITGQNGDIDRSKYENEENDYQREKNAAEIQRCTLKHRAQENKWMFQKKSSWTPWV